MGPNVEHILNAQHCLTIAAGFIAIIGACASLITSANNKAESLSTGIRAATKEHRERSQDSSRCKQLQDQLQLFKKRFVKVQQAQRLLFFTIGIFIASAVIFISLGLYMIYDNAPENPANAIVRSLIFVMWLLVAIGTSTMVKAIYNQFWEVGKSYLTICIETKDCVAPDPSEISSLESAPLARHAAG
jgi:ABC-type sugar transport system permease subunit